MFNDLRTAVLHGLSRTLELLPEGSPFAFNTQAAIAQIDNIVDYRGITFTNERTKRGVLAIVDEAFRHSDYDILVFLDPELHDIREIIDRAPIATYYYSAHPTLCLDDIGL